jgi:hypothetical protein
MVVKNGLLLWRMNIRCWEKRLVSSTQKDLHLSNLMKRYLITGTCLTVLQNFLCPGYTEETGSPEGEQVLRVHMRAVFRRYRAGHVCWGTQVSAVCYWRRPLHSASRPGRWLEMQQRRMHRLHSSCPLRPSSNGQVRWVLFVVSTFHYC